MFLVAPWDRSFTAKRLTVGLSSLLAPFVPRNYFDENILHGFFSRFPLSCLSGILLIDLLFWKKYFGVSMRTRPPVWNDCVSNPAARLRLILLLFDPEGVWIWIPSNFQSACLCFSFWRRLNKEEEEGSCWSNHRFLFLVFSITKKTVKVNMDSIYFIR